MGMEIVVEGQYLAVFNSTHRVLKAEALLKARKNQFMLIPAPRAIQADCGLALRFDPDQYDTIMYTLSEQNLLPAFLCQLINGTYTTIKEFQHENN
jgi:hypothetical protein